MRYANIGFPRGHNTFVDVFVRIEENKIRCMTRSFVNPFFFSKKLFREVKT